MIEHVVTPVAFGLVSSGLVFLLQQAFAWFHGEPVPAPHLARWLGHHGVIAATFAAQYEVTRWITGA